MHKSYCWMLVLMMGLLSGYGFYVAKSSHKKQTEREWIQSWLENCEPSLRIVDNDFNENEFYLVDKRMMMRVTENPNNDWQKLNLLVKLPHRIDKWSGVVHVQKVGSGLSKVVDYPDGSVLAGSYVLYGDSKQVSKLNTLFSTR